MTKDDFLSHHGILGMKWGLRRYQNEDGTLTAAGKARYAKVYNNPKLKARDEEEARRGAASIRDYHGSRANVYLDAARRFREQGDTVSAEIAESKAKAEKWIADRFSKKIAAIDSGDIQAGRDFIVQRDYNLTPRGLVAELNIFEQKVDDVVKGTKDLAIGNYG